MAKRETKEPKVEIPKVRAVKIEEYYSSDKKWKGLIKYDCKLCKFDSLVESEIKIHIMNVHIPKPTKPKVEHKLFDRFGNEINK